MDNVCGLVDVPVNGTVGKTRDERGYEKRVEGTASLVDEEPSYLLGFLARRRAYLVRKCTTHEQKLLE